MMWSDGVSEVFGKVMVHKSENSTHSSLQQSPNKFSNHITHPFMAESCGGGDDDIDEWIFNERTHRCSTVVKVDQIAK